MESKLQHNGILKSIITWLPSILVVLFFVQNALDKIINANELDKAGLTGYQLIIVGAILLIATALYMIDKTMLIGTIILALYMTCIVFLHMHKGKPFLIASLIVVGIIYGACIRRLKLIR